MGMEEEVVIRLGLDGRPLSAALRGVKRTVTDWASDLRSSVGGMLGGLFAPLMGGGVAIGLAKVADSMERIKAASEALGTSTGFFQDLQNAGRGAGVNPEAIEKMLTAFTKGLPEGADVEQSFFAFADRLKDIEDPATRARVAMDAFGKSGIDVIKIAGQGSAALKDMAAQFSKFEDTDIDAVLAAKDELEKTQSTITTAIGKFVGALAFGARVYGKWSSDSKYRTPGSVTGIKPDFAPGFMQAVKEVDAEDLADKDAKAIARRRAQELAERAKAMKAAADAAAEYDTKLRRLVLQHASLDEKLALLNQEWVAESKAAKNAKDEVEKYAHALKAAELAFEIDAVLTKRDAEIAKELEKDRKDALEREKELLKEAEEAEKKRLDAIKKQTEAKERQLAMQERVTAAERRWGQDEIAWAGAHTSRSQFTLQEMAGLGIDRFTTGAMRQQIVGARNVAWMENYARNLAAHGYTEQSQAMFSKADALRSGLTGLTDSERYPFKALEKAMVESEDHLKELLRKAAAEGLVVQPVIGE